ncbi:F-box domain [Dillenia turbinata]|uniref:F-box domain n=1 Tax=Dillenia turbinata TaxID=194707 RepID=A0AAN8ZLF1_9MAGN
MHSLAVPFSESAQPPMFFLLISCFSFILISKSLSHSLILPWKSEIGLLKLSPLSCEQFSNFVTSWFRRGSLAISLVMPLRKKGCSKKVVNADEKGEISLLDLPDLALECILERLSPAGLCNIAGVCSSLRERCQSDYLWEKHMKQKWVRVIGDATYRGWQLRIAQRKQSIVVDPCMQKGLLKLVQKLQPISWVRSNFQGRNKSKNPLTVDSIMTWYLSLERGKFSFPSQVYNRENGHIGFMLSCYDAEVTYNSETDTFLARYSPHGRQMTEDGIPWDRLRAPPVNTSAYELYLSDCLNDLRPGDHVEIQWRRNKEFPYGWWYGVVGHLELCNGIEHHCRCHKNDTVILEFNQYAPGSRWRRTTVNRKNHREEGDEVDGFYGGIRKLYKEDEISMWKRHWPSQMLE